MEVGHRCAERLKKWLLRQNTNKQWILHRIFWHWDN